MCLSINTLSGSGVLVISASNKTAIICSTFETRERGIYNYTTPTYRARYYVYQLKATFNCRLLLFHNKRHIGRRRWFNAHDVPKMIGSTYHVHMITKRQLCSYVSTWLRIVRPIDDYQWYMLDTILKVYGSTQARVHYKKDYTLINKIHGRWWVSMCRHYFVLRRCLVCFMIHVAHYYCHWLFLILHRSPPVFTGLI